MQFNSARLQPVYSWRAGGLDGICGVLVEVAMCNEVILSHWTVSGAQHAPVAWPPFTFDRPSAARCRVSTYVHPSSLTQAPRDRSSVQWGRAAIPVNCRGAQHAQVVRPPSTFGRNLRPSYEPPHAHVLGPKLLLSKMKGLAFQVSCACSTRCRPPPRSSPCSPWHLTLRPHPA